MYLDALEFLEEEREAFRPFEALDGLTDEQLQVPLEAAHGWSGRDLIGHLIAPLEDALAAARELAVNETSPTIVRADAQWDAEGDAMNDRLVLEWAALPLAEVRDRFRNVPGELRGTLTVVPETRWLKHKTNMEWIMGETIDHYADHEADLAAVLAAAGAEES
jgi:hypothetical protein